MANVTFDLVAGQKLNSTMALGGEGAGENTVQDARTPPTYPPLHLSRLFATASAVTVSLRLLPFVPRHYRSSL